MTRRMLGTALAVTALVVGAACGFGGTDDTPEGGPPADAGAGLPGLGSSPEFIRDPDHQYRVVNLHQYNGQPGGAVDVYPARSSDLTALGSSVAPVASGLGYGQASEPLQPGGMKSAFGDPSYGLGILPHTPTETGSANLKMDISDSNQSKTWRRAIVVLGGTGNGLQARTFHDTTGPTEPNAVPALATGKVSLMIDTAHAGDPNGPNPVRDFWLAGTAAGCLKASNDGTANSATAVNIQGSAFVTVDPGTPAVGFWPATAPDYGTGHCTGAPAFSVALPPLGAGTRAALFVYGTDAAHLAGVVVPFDS